MKNLLLCFVLVSSAGAVAEDFGADPTVPALGINLAGPADYNTELPFVDVFRMARPWISQREGAAWGKGPELELDEHGFVTELEEGCYAETMLCTIDSGHYPSGTYTVLYDGEGALETWNAAEVASREPGKMLLSVNSGRGAFSLRIMETNPENPVRNIRVIMPGFEDTYAGEPFHPAFLRRWHGVVSIRFMDWMHTNGSEIETWDDRPVLEDMSFSGKGVALEWMIDLANRLDAHPWFCMPHLADDDYVRKFAEMVKARLEPGLNVYVEYSNEVWNGIFAQHRYAAERGQALGFAEQPWEAAWRYNAHRSVEIFKIWEEVFGGAERLVRVLATQGSNPYVSRQILEFEDAYKHADALGIAPYVSCNVPREGDGLNAAQVAGWNLDRLFEYIESKALPDAIAWIKGQNAVAKEFGLALVAYEGGQHLVGVGGGENNETLTRLLHRANRDPRMGVIYKDYHRAWTEAGGGLFCTFSSVSEWSKWGSWGLLEYYDQAPQSSPKFMATVEWAQRLGQPMRVPGVAP